MQIQRIKEDGITLIKCYFYKQMDNNEMICGIFTDDLDDVLKTINNYTKKCEINNLTIALRECTYPDNKEEMLALTYKLVDWYTSNYDDIQSNNYIYNKREHYHSIDVLNNLLKLLLI